MTQVEQALAYVDAGAVRHATLDMMGIPSATGDESALARYLADRLQAVGLRTELQEVADGRCNLLAIVEGTGGGASLLFGGHLDTPYRGDEEGIRERGAGYQPAPREDGDWIFGLGASNMKGGLASALVAVEAIGRAGTRLKGDLVFAGLVGETLHVPVASYQSARYHGTGLGAQALMARGFRTDAAVFAIQTLSAVSIASGGFVYFELLTRSDPFSTYRRASAPAAPTPRDAMQKMLAALPVLQQRMQDAVADRRFAGEPSSYGTPIAMEAGNPFRPSKRPPFCRCYFEVGLMGWERAGDVIAEMQRTVAALNAATPDLGMDVRVVHIAEGAAVPADAPIVAAVSAAHAATHGQPPNITWDGWCTDSGVLTRAGIPAVNYGPQGRSMSGDPRDMIAIGEHVHVGDLATGAGVFVRLACDVCNRPPGALQTRPTE